MKYIKISAAIGKMQPYIISQVARIQASMGISPEEKQPSRTINIIHWKLDPSLLQWYAPYAGFTIEKITPADWKITLGRPTKWLKDLADEAPEIAEKWRSVSSTEEYKLHKVFHKDDVMPDWATFGKRYKEGLEDCTEQYLSTDTIYMLDESQWWRVEKKDLWNSTTPVSDYIEFLSRFKPAKPFNFKVGIVDTDYGTLLEQFERPAVVS